MELGKTQMQVRPDCTKVGQTIKQIVESSGIKGMTRGLGITICREVPAFGIFFSSNEILVNLKKDSNLWVFTAGGIAGINSWIFTYPIDVLKSRLQADVIGSGAQYKNVVQCFKKSVATDGYNCLFR